MIILRHYFILKFFHKNIFLLFLTLLGKEKKALCKLKNNQKQFIPVSTDVIVKTTGIIFRCLLRAAKN